MSGVHAVEEYLKTASPEALSFLNLYMSYINRIDDIIDEKITECDYVVKTFSMASELYSHSFFQRNRDLLVVTDQLIANTYRDSERLRQTEQPEIGIALSHCGYNMIFAVLLIVGGVDKLNEFSLAVRSQAHNNI